MSINLFSPVPYLSKQHYSANCSLLLPEMVISDGPLTPVSYQLGEVDGRAALLTDLTRSTASRYSLLLYVLEQKVFTYKSGKDEFKLSVEVELVSVSDFVTVPSTLTSPYKDTHGTLALVGDRFADPMSGFGLVCIENGRASHQRVVTNCTFYKRFTTEVALQNAAISYGGLTGETTA